MEPHLGTRARVVVDLLVVCGSLALVSGLVACMLGVPAALSDLNFLRLDRVVGDLGPGLLLCGAAGVCFAGVLLAGGWGWVQRMALGTRIEGGDADRCQGPADVPTASPAPAPLVSAPAPLSPLAWPLDVTRAATGPDSVWVAGGGTFNAEDAERYIHHKGYKGGELEGGDGGDHGGPQGRGARVVQWRAIQRAAVQRRPRSRTSWWATAGRALGGIRKIWAAGADRTGERRAGLSRGAGWSGSAARPVVRAGGRRLRRRGLAARRVRTAWRGRARRAW
jgi:hypothetical protein